MAPWRLDPLVEERLERNRAQLAEPGGPHEGSADMRVRARSSATCLGARTLSCGQQVSKLLYRLKAPPFGQPPNRTIWSTPMRLWRTTRSRWMALGGPEWG